ncbi:MAG: ribose-phosphate pyrophosphokinase [Syntrophorhabdales bacterium]
MDKLRIFSGNANSELAERICAYLEVEKGKASVSSFSDGEIQVEIEESVRGMDVFLIQPTCPPVNENIMELLVMIDAMKRASVSRINVVIPYYGYARQDRKVAPRAPISARLVADLIEVAGATRVLAMDLHVGQIQGFFNIPVDHLYAMPVQLDYLSNIDDRIVVVSPDAGGVERARAFAKRMKENTTIAIIDKRREKADVSKLMNIVGEVKGKVAILLDDMIDTGGTIVQSSEALIRDGASRVYACCTHAVLSGQAVDKLNKSPIHELVITNTIPLREKAKQLERARVLDVSPILAEAIRRIHNEASVSSLFV